MHHMHLTIHTNVLETCCLESWEYYSQVDRIFGMYLGSLTIGVDDKLEKAEELVPWVLGKPRKGSVKVRSA
jgi:hypothetical protein